MAATTIGVLHPGEMGSVMGAVARGAGARVLWASDGRSAETGRRAAGAGLEDTKTLEKLVAMSDVIFSICPPHAALDLARAVAARGFSGLFVDANAVSPKTALEVGRIVARAGATFIDGGIIGPPPKTGGTTRLYLAGPSARRVAELFAQGPLEAVALEGEPGAASALKMAYAAYTKGTAALLMSIRAFASRSGVDQALLSEWKRSQPELPALADRAVRTTPAKAWRFVGEMEEMAATFEHAGLPDGFCEGAAEIYRRLAPFKNAAASPSAADVVAALVK